mmetsp:Transcript_2884/g.6797  ORF Transcript_2884/g.6797 Transcript_2884/m.6797 type:complete len:348 (+) Transcript_2884:152-1195(+)
MANRPASVHTLRRSAPLKPSASLASASYSISPRLVIFDACILRMSMRDDSLGSGISILRSRRPGRSSAGSSTSGRFVAMMHFTLPSASKPSIWLSSSMSVRWISRSADVPSLKRRPPMASISSMKITHGSCARAYANISRMTRADSPMYLSTIADATTLRNAVCMFDATARASSVLPVPGGPYSSTPLGCAMPSASNSSGCLMGSSITSLISLICFDRPPTMSYVESGTFSTFISDTSGSTLLGRILCSTYESARSATRVFGVTSLIAIFLSRSTTYLPSGPTLTSTFVLPIGFTTSPTYEPGSSSRCSSSRSERTCAFSWLRCASSRRKFCCRSRVTTSSSSIFDR